MNSLRRSNAQLRALLAEGAWTEQQFAVMVNRTGAEAGIRLRYDRTSVSHWLAGVRPRKPTPVLIAEALSRGLGRPITTAEAGLNLRQVPCPGKTGRDPVAELVTLPERTAESHPYQLRELDVPAWPPLIPRRPDHPQDAISASHAEIIQTAESLAQVFSTSDRAFGGGSTRGALIGYLAYHLSPILRSSARPSVQLRLHAITAQLAYLCGFMCFDDELHGLAQRYYVTALSLAAEAEDPISYAVTLRAMSVQAQSLGHHRQALHLAEAAVTIGKSADSMRQAFLHGHLASARAAAGDRAGAGKSFATAERFLEKTTSMSTSLTGTYHLASLAHQEAEVRRFLGDREAAVAALTRSIRHRPAPERRARALNLAKLAELQLASGHLDRAVRTWRAFLDDYPHLVSGRADTALATMRALLRPHARHAAAAALLTPVGGYSQRARPR
jgi:tetratricopeptide (TPR) repeat protein